MTSQFNAIPPIPSETARAVKAVYGRSNFYILVGEHVEEILEGVQLEYLSTVVRTRAGGATLPLVTFFQFLEGLTDAQAVDAARTRIEWKFALHLPMNAPVLNEYELCAFRQHVLVNQAVKEAFQKMLDRLKKFADQENRSVDTEQIIAAICLLSRAGIIVKCMGTALEALATSCPKWLVANAPPHWYKRYRQKSDAQQIPNDSQKIEALIQTIGKDGQYLLEMIDKTDALNCKNLPEIQNLRREWDLQFDHTNGNLPCLLFKCRNCMNYRLSH